MSRFTALLCTCIGLVFISFSSHAEINPFKKAKEYSFGDNAAWYFKEGAAVKTGSRRDGSDTLYYHLNVNKDRLRLRLSKNDPSGELENTRELDGVDINDVLVDGKTLPRFQWCLQNQERPGDKLKGNAIVINDTCINPGNGDFIINLDERSKKALRFARSLAFVVEPYGRPIKLTFSMGGFDSVMAKVDRPEPPPAPVVKAAPAARAPAAAAAPRPKPKPVSKTCHANPPADYTSVVKAVAYPCDNATKKAQAEKSVNSLVVAEKQKREAAAAERKRQQEALRKEEAATKRVEAEFEKRQAAIWIKRCQKHWNRGESPCYCEKYLDQAPAGVTNTCGH